MGEWCIGQARDGSDACACVHDSKKRRKGESLKCVSLISRAKHTLARGLWGEGRKKRMENVMEDTRCEKGKIEAELYESTFDESGTESS